MRSCPPSSPRQNRIPCQYGSRHDCTAPTGANLQAELEALYEKLSPGGVLILDDYGHWEGVRRAVDEFFASRTHKILLDRID